MRALGLRPQILLLLGGLLVVAFAPLQLALATYTRVTLRQLDDEQARALGHTLAAHVRQSAALAGPRGLVRELQQGAADSGLLAARASSARGEVAEFGDAAVLGVLADASREGRVLRAGDHRVWAIEVLSGDGAGAGAGATVGDGAAAGDGAAVAHAAGTTRTWLAIDAERSSARGQTLIGMFGLYAFLIAVALLTLAYFALTRLIVRPLEALSQAAENVTLGKRRLSPPATSARELGELGVSLERMTDRLLFEEESLRNKIAEIERARADLASAQTKLVRSERLASVGRLSAGLAHEIGNPIAAMMGLADLVLDGDLEPNEQRDFIRRMRSEIERVHRTLKDLLQFARPRRDADGALAASGDVEAAIHDTAALVVHQPSMRDVELCIDVYPGLPRVTLASEQLSQVLLNLILNASDAVQGRAGGRIAVTARAEEGGVRVEVEDNGTGVAPAAAEHLFEPFFTTKEVGKGTGLGLSVCQALVSAAGGALGLDAEFTSGARFVVQLPAADDATHAAAPPEPRAPAAREPARRATEPGASAPERPK